MVARGLRLDHRGCAGRVEAGEQNGRFDLRRGDGRAIFDRRCIARALEHDRTAPALGLESISAPMSLSGSRMRRIGRFRSEASPSKVAVIPWPPTTPIISREPVPALPKSRISRGGRIAPSPGPRIRHWPGPSRSTAAPSAWQALPVRSTSSPSSSPSTFVSPQARRPIRKARWEIDLSPGGRTRPFSGLARTALRGEAAGCDE